MGARRVGQEGALAPPPWKFKNMGAPPKDNLTRNYRIPSDYFQIVPKIFFSHFYEVEHFKGLTLNLEVPQ